MYSKILLGNRIIRLQILLIKHCLVVVPHTLCDLALALSFSAYPRYSVAN